MLFLFFTASLFAGGLQVSPVHIVFKPGENITLLQLRNVEKKSITFQLSVKRWEQKKGKGYYVKTRDVLVTPPLVKIAPGQIQNIRIAYLGTPPEKREKAYRIFMRQVITKHKHVSGLEVILNISVPVFVQPQGTLTPALTWTATCKKKHLRLTAFNNGNEHAQVTHLLIETPKGEKIIDQKVFKYLFPGNAYMWRVKMKSGCKRNYKLTYTNNKPTAEPPTQVHVS